MKLLEDRVSGSGPAKGLGVRVVVGDELIDALHELLDAVNEPRRIALSVISAKNRSTFAIGGAPDLPPLGSSPGLKIELGNPWCISPVN
jgi:hypothetical protein